MVNMQAIKDFSSPRFADRFGYKQRSLTRPCTFRDAESFATYKLFYRSATLQPALQKSERRKRYSSHRNYL